MKSKRATKLRRPGQFAGARGYTAGQHVWFLKSMRMCSFVEDNGDGLCTVMRLDTGKQMTASYDGIEAV